MRGMDLVLKNKTRLAHSGRSESSCDDPACCIYERIWLADKMLDQEARGGERASDQ